MEIHGTRGQRLLREYVSGWAKTKQSLAEACGVSPTLLSHFLSGRRRPTLDSVFGIRAATGVPAEAWLEDDVWEEADAERVSGAESGVCADAVPAVE